MGIIEFIGYLIGLAIGDIIVMTLASLIIGLFVKKESIKFGICALITLFLNITMLKDPEVNKPALIIIMIFLIIIIIGSVGCLLEDRGSLLDILKEKKDAKLADEIREKQNSEKK